MATITAEANTIFQVIPTLSVATTPPTVAASTKLTVQSGSADAVTGAAQLPTQYAAVSATMSTAAATATVVFFLADDDTVGTNGAGKIRQVTATIAATTTRASHNTAAGDYVATVTFSESNRNTIDLEGLGKEWPNWYACLTVISGGTLTLYIKPGRAI